MQSAVSATLYHVANTAENPSHDFCPSCPSSWRGWKRNPEDYKHTHGLPEVKVELLEPIYDELSEADLLSKCLHGKTQNPNESFNRTIWDRCQKEQWVSRKVIEQSCFMAIGYFNDGDVTLKCVLEMLGTNPGYYTLAGCKNQDPRRISHANRKSTEGNRLRRKLLRGIHKGCIDKKVHSEGPVYEKGAF